jgi:hypothetical protein
MKAHHIRKVCRKLKDVVRHHRIMRHVTLAVRNRNRLQVRLQARKERSARDAVRNNFTKAACDEQRRVDSSRLADYLCRRYGFGNSTFHSCCLHGQAVEK